MHTWHTCASMGKVENLIKLVVMVCEDTDQGGIVLVQKYTSFRYILELRSFLKMSIIFKSRKFN